MRRCFATMWVLVAVASSVLGEGPTRAQEELAAARRERRERMGPAARLAEAVRREVAGEHERIARREVEIAGLYRTEASYIYIDRERAAGRDPKALVRERDKLLADEWYRAQGRIYSGAAERRLASEARLLAGRRGRWADERLGHAGQLRRAEQWAILGAEGLVLRERMRREEIIRRVLEVAEEMEREAGTKRRAQEGGNPAKRP